MPLGQFNADFTAVALVFRFVGDVIEGVVGADGHDAINTVALYPSVFPILQQEQLFVKWCHFLVIDTVEGGVGMKELGDVCLRDGLDLFHVSTLFREQAQTYMRTFRPIFDEEVLL